MTHAAMRFATATERERTNSGWKKPWWCVMLLVAGTGCMRSPSAAADAQVDPVIATALAAIKAIDNHAHPARPTAPGEAADTGYDALPVEHLEASSDPVR